MTIRTLAEYLPEHPFFADFPDDVIGLLAGCATNVHFSTGEALFLEGEAANALYLIRRGRVAIQVHQPASGATTLATVDEGDVVGWSWLVPPYRWMFDARAMEETSAVSFDATCLRQKAEQDPVAGYALLSRVVQIMHSRLQAARMQMLDMYGAGAR